MYERIFEVYTNSITCIHCMKDDYFKWYQYFGWTWYCDTVNMPHKLQMYYVCIKSKITNLVVQEQYCVYLDK